MKRLDLKYISHLVVQAQEGSSEALAELYAATYQNQYQFAYQYLQDEFLAQDALHQTYVQAFREIGSLGDPSLFLAQLSQIGYKVCFYTLRKGTMDTVSLEQMTVSIDGNAYSLNRLFHLPFSESQVLLMRYCDHLNQGKIARMMHLNRRAVRRYQKQGRARLRQFLES